MKKTLPFLLTLTLTAALTACGGSKPSGNADAGTAAAETTAASETSAASETTAAVTETADTANTKAETTAKAEAADTTDSSAASGITVRVGSLKGPTSMGLVYLMEQDEQNASLCDYEFTMVTAADELLANVVSEKLDIALVPANVASVLYNKTKGGISVIDINTLGVLYIVSSDDSISSVADLKGRTICLTGKGTSPDYVLHYLLSANGLSEDDVTLEYKSEAAEVAAVLKEQPDTIGLLPQPFVTAACAQNESLKIVLNLTEEWDKVQGEGGSLLVTGVTIVRNAFLQEYPEIVDTFLTEHQASADFSNENPDKAAELIAKLGIIEKAPVARKALPYCNITCLTGEEMKAALNGYLQVLADQDPKSIGGKLPEDDFYYVH